MDPIAMETEPVPNDPKYDKLNIRRASMTLEERQTEFREMLLERGVSTCCVKQKTSCSSVERIYNIPKTSDHSWKCHSW